MGNRRNAYRILIDNPERKIPLGIPRCSWQDNIKIVLREIRCEVVNWIELWQGRVQRQTFVKMVIVFRDP
jgi:hypothetical protein